MVMTSQSAYYIYTVCPKVLLYCKKLLQEENFVVAKNRKKFFILRN